MSKILNTRIQQKYDSESNWNTVESTFVPLDGEVVVYGSNDLTAPKLKVGDGTTTLEELPFLYAESSAPELTPIPYPTVSGTYRYNGAAQTVNFNDFDTNKLYVYGTTTQTNAGTYEVIFEPKSGYCWEDGSATLYTLNWTINKGTPTLTLSSTSMTLTDVNESFGSTVTTNSTGTISVVSSNTSIAEAYVSSGTVYVYSPNKKNGTATITVTVGATSNYNSASATISVDTDFMEVDSVLENNSWEVIATVARNGNARSYWSVGEIKTVSEPYLRAFILDFDHPAGGTIQFCLFYDTDLDGTHFVWSKDAVYFQEVIGGGDYPKWSLSTLRNLLQANGTYGSSILPEEVWSVLAEVHNHSSYKDSSYSAGENIYTYDLMYIPSEIEILGSDAQYALSTDFNYEWQFEYFASGNKQPFCYRDEEYTPTAQEIQIITRNVTFEYTYDPSYGSYTYTICNIVADTITSYVNNANNYYSSDYPQAPTYYCNPVFSVGGY